VSNRAQSYVWRLRVHGKSTPRKFLLVRIADMVSDDSMSCYAKTRTLAAYLDIDPRRVKEYLSDLARDGHISVLERTWQDGSQRDSRILLHGPWDAFGGTGKPFPEITLPKLDPTHPIEVTDQIRDELRQRYVEHANEFGQFPDGNPRCRWRLGSRAHSIVCWYGIGNIVVHNGRSATVTAVTATDSKNRPLPQEHVQLHYIDDDTTSESWVNVDEITEPIKENTSSGGGDEIGTGGVPKSAPHRGDEIGTGGVPKSAPHGGAESAPHESSSEPKVEPSSPNGEKNASDDDPAVRYLLRIPEAAVDPDQAAAYVQHLRSKDIRKPLGYMRTLHKNKDLLEDIAAWKRQARTSTQAGMGGNCTIHSGQEMPCLPCKSDLAAGGQEADRVIELYLSDPDARPDLTDNRHLIRRLNERQPAGSL